MLTEIYCSSFGEVKKIPFTPGLNVIQGRSGNSIGKSTFLKIVDYAFGGKYYAETNNDIIKHVGDHKICFCHSFGDNEYCFIRNASSPNKVYQCDDKNYTVSREMTLNDFNNWLVKMYELHELQLSFRYVVGLYSRVWNKPNKEVNRPLFNYNSQTVADSITVLIKLFNRYNSIRELHEQSEFLKKRLAARKQAAEYNFISLPTKQEAPEIEAELSEINAKIVELQGNIAIGSVDNISTIDEEYLALTDQRTVLLSQRSHIKRDIQRCRNNSQQLDKIESASFSTLIDFFPTINISRLEEVSGFHDSLRELLREELNEEERRLCLRLNEVEDAITRNDKDIQKYTELPTHTSEALENLKKLLLKHNQLQMRYEQYTDSVAESSQRKENKKQLEDEMASITLEISNAINEKTAEYSRSISTSNRKPPVLQLGPFQYFYGVEDNTGTGKAYTDLILFDLAVLALTKLPILIHDSFLFNNIDDNTKKSFIKLYCQFPEKQVFIALDNYLGTDDKEIDSILFSKTRLFLSESVKLFGIDWAADKEE